MTSLLLNQCVYSALIMRPIESLIYNRLYIVYDYNNCNILYQYIMYIFYD